MAQRGRKAKATIIKLRLGKPGHRPLPRGEPTFRTCKTEPSPPAYLNAIARREWRRVTAQLVAARVLTPADLASLAAYCTAVSRHEVASRFIDENGQTYEANGHLVACPQVRIAASAADCMRKFANEFGITPASRARVKAGEPPPDAENDLDRLLG